MTPTVIRKPSPFASLNFRHPLTWGLTECCLFTPHYQSATTYYRNLAYANPSNPEYALDKGGIAEYGTTTGAVLNTSLGANFELGSTLAFPFTTANTFLFGGKKMNYSAVVLCRYPRGGQKTIGSCLYGGGSTPEFCGPWSANGYGIYEGTYSAGWQYWPTYLRGFAAGMNHFMLLAWTVGYHQSGWVPLSMYFNGQRVYHILANSSINDATTICSTTAVTFGGRSATANCSGELIAAWVYRGRLLSEADVAQFSISPFQMFTDYSPLNQPFNQGTFGHPRWGDFNIAIG